MIQIEIDKSDLSAVSAAMYGIKNGQKTVLTRAVNKTMTGVKTDATQEIYNILSLTKTRIKKSFKIKRMTWGSPTANIRSTGKPVGLATFLGTREINAGVSSKVKRTGPRKVTKDAFIGMRGNTKHAYWRRYKGAKVAFRPWVPYSMLPEKYRLPLKRLTGPRIQDIYDDPVVMKAVLKKADVRMTKNLNHELDYLLSTL